MRRIQRKPLPPTAAAAMDPSGGSLDVSSTLPPGMDRLDMMMGNTDSLALTGRPSSR